MPNVTRPREVPGKHKAKAIPREWPHSGSTPADVAQRVYYVGSGEHKTAPFGSVKPEPRSDGSFCDPKYQGQQARIDVALRLAVQHGCVSQKFDQQIGVPRYIWGVLDDVLYEARLMTAPPDGAYKAYPISVEELPRDPARKIETLRREVARV